jgi:hypothetical protein|tara:strand:+ start:547 stop:828 length:282 start_codon:yes stop_codon:yes gene_type:complete
MNLHKAIRFIHNEVVTIYGNNESNIVAFDVDGNEITINWTQVNSWQDPEEWKINRKTEYPTFEDCIHALLDGGDTLTELQEKRQAVKTKYPKP